MMKPPVLFLILLLPFISADPINLHTTNHKIIDEAYATKLDVDRHAFYNYVVNHMNNSIIEKATKILDRLPIQAPQPSVFLFTYIHDDSRKERDWEQFHDNYFTFILTDDKEKIKLASEYREEGKSHRTMRLAEKTCVADVDVWCLMNPNTILIMERQHLVSHHLYIYPRIVCPLNSKSAHKDYRAIIADYEREDDETTETPPTTGIFSKIFNWLKSPFN